MRLSGGMAGNRRRATSAKRFHPGMTQTDFELTTTAIKSLGQRSSRHELVVEHGRSHSSPSDEQSTDATSHQSNLTRKLVPVQGDKAHFLVRLEGHDCGLIAQLHSKEWVIAGNDCTQARTKDRDRGQSVNLNIAVRVRQGSLGERRAGQEGCKT